MAISFHEELWRLIFNWSSKSSWSRIRMMSSNGRFGAESRDQRLMLQESCWWGERGDSWSASIHAADAPPPHPQLLPPDVIPVTRVSNDMVGVQI